MQHNTVIPNGESHHSLTEQTFIISSCLEALGYKKLAIAVKKGHDQRLINRCIQLIEQESISRKDYDILERLYFAGLIYG